MKTKLVSGDCIEKMKEMEEHSIDTVITDPPYGLKFMGKKWDYDVPSVEVFEEMLRVTKPGGTLLCFAGSRTQHRMAVNLEDAGWIIKDTIMWLYGSGFPKATDISKQLDKIGKTKGLFEPFAKHLSERIKESGLSQKEIAKNFLSKTGGLTGCVWNWANGANVPTVEQWKILQPLLDLSDEFLPLIQRIEAEREVIGKHQAPAKEIYKGGELSKDVGITKASTPEAKLWNGWKSHGLKPAYEPIIVAMKPNDGTYANNALKHGVSGLNIDGGRIGTEKRDNPQYDGGDLMAISKGGEQEWRGKKESVTGRFPANIILDEEAGKMLDEQSGFSKSTIDKKEHTGKGTSLFVENKITKVPRHDSGGASRFFYCAKASKSERNAGCEGLEEKDAKKQGGAPIGRITSIDKRGGNISMSNHHPTVKPLKLMEYLCTLTKTPTGGVVLDPFMGSGTTGLACQNTGREFIGIEMDEEYMKIAEARLKANEKLC